MLKSERDIMTSSKEKFCLRWNDFERNISGGFQEIRSDKDFFDVTLGCEDGQVSAHKLLLSACSPFFRTVLRRNPHQHPLLYFKGIRHAELSALMDFMYQAQLRFERHPSGQFIFLPNLCYCLVSIDSSHISMYS